MRVGVTKEREPGERRVALVPDSVAKLVAAGFTVEVEKGAGADSSLLDAAYAEAGATLVDDALGADAVVKVRKPSADEIARLREGTVLIAFLQPLTDREGIDALAARGVIGFAMESIPRISRAQAMDALSSQANVAGYKAVLARGRPAAEVLPDADDRGRHDRAGEGARARRRRRRPAGDRDRAPARRRRRRASTCAPSSREQVESLGATFLDLGVHGEETEGGYATELTPEQQRQQQEALEARLPDFDVVITTALVPGRPAPRLIPASAVAAMRPGSVIVDLAAEAGGNCELTAPGEEVVREQRHDRRLHRPAEPDGLPREPALLAQRPRTAPAPRAGGNARARLRGRDHRRRLRHPEGGNRVNHGTLLVFEVTILVLAIFLGFEVISKVPTLLHTPLMSGTNAIHGIVIVGAMLVAGTATDTTTKVIGFVAVVLASANVVGGFVVTDRMLEMFKKREPPKPAADDSDPPGPSEQEPQRPALPGHDRDLHPRAALPLLAGDGAAREPGRRDRDGARDRRHVRAEGHGQLRG